MAKSYRNDNFQFLALISKTARKCILKFNKNQG